MSLTKFADDAEYAAWEQQLARIQQYNSGRSIRSDGSTGWTYSEVWLPAYYAAGGTDDNLVAALAVFNARLSDMETEQAGSAHAAMQQPGYVEEVVYSITLDIRLAHLLDQQNEDHDREHRLSAAIDNVLALRTARAVDRGIANAHVRMHQVDVQRIENAAGRAERLVEISQRPGFAELLPLADVARAAADHARVVVDHPDPSVRHAAVRDLNEATAPLAITLREIDARRLRIMELGAGINRERALRWYERNAAKLSSVRAELAHRIAKKQGRVVADKSDYARAGKTLDALRAARIVPTSASGQRIMTHAVKTAPVQPLDELLADFNAAFPTEAPAEKPDENKKGDDDVTPAELHNHLAGQPKVLHSAPPTAEELARAESARAKRAAERPTIAQLRDRAAALLKAEQAARDAFNADRDNPQLRETLRQAERDYTRAASELKTLDLAEQAAARDEKRAAERAAQQAQREAAAAERAAQRDAGAAERAYQSALRAVPAIAGHGFLEIIESYVAAKAALAAAHALKPAAVVQFAAAVSHRVAERLHAGDNERAALHNVMAPIDSSPAAMLPLVLREGEALAGEYIAAGDLDNVQPLPEVAFETLPPPAPAPAPGKEPNALALFDEQPALAHLTERQRRAVLGGIEEVLDAQPDQLALFEQLGQTEYLRRVLANMTTERLQALAAAGNERALRGQDNGPEGPK